MRKNARRTVELKCNHCQRSFTQLKKEYDRQTKKGRTKFYCNLSCAAMKSESLIKWKNFAIDNPDFILNALERSKKERPEEPHTRAFDALSAFRYMINKAKQRGRRKRKLETPNISAKYLKKLWEKQDGVCPYTGIKMILKPERKHITNILNASLDRIDSSKGYIIGNVEFVCLGINYAKNGFSKEEMINFIKLIRSSAI